MSIPELEIDRRRPVWVALSDLYLDTELQPSDHDRIAGTIVASGYSIDEIEKILRREVGPIVGMNMLSVTGEWTGFNEDWLVESILRYQSSWRRFLPRFTAFGMIRSHWQEIQRLVAAKRAG